MSSNLLAPHYSLENGLPSHRSNGPLKPVAIVEGAPDHGGAENFREGVREQEQKFV
jgi:hypothetical protein